MDSDTYFILGIVVQYYFILLPKLFLLFAVSVSSSVLDITYQCGFSFLFLLLLLYFKYFLAR